MITHDILHEPTAHVHHNRAGMLACLRLNCYSFCLVNHYTLKCNTFFTNMYMPTQLALIMQPHFLCIDMLNFISVRVFVVQTVGHTI